MVGSLIAKPTRREDTRRIAPAEPWTEGWRQLDRDGMEGFLEVYARTLWLRDTGQPVAILGVMVVVPGVAEAWAFIHTDAHPFAKSLVRQARALKEEAFAKLGLWRIQAPIQERFRAGCRFAEAAGLRAEARLASWFHPQEAAVIYSEVRP